MSEHLANLMSSSKHALMDWQRTWGRALLGVALVEASLRNTWVTQKELADVCGVSTETIRRYLKMLENTGRVRLRIDGKTHYYQADKEWSKRALDSANYHFKHMIFELHKNRP